MNASIFNTFYRKHVKCGYRCRLLITFITAFFLLSSAGTLLVTTYIHNILEDAGIAEGRKVTDNFARASSLALILGVENVRRDAEITLAFPGVIHVSLFDANGTKVFALGVSHALVESNNKLSEPFSTIVHDTLDAWLFSAPVYDSEPRPVDSPYNLNETKAELLGFVNVVRSKDTLNRTKTSIILYGIIITSVASVLLTVLMIRLIDYYIRPVEELAMTFSNTDVSSLPGIVPENGPPEIQNMSRAINQLMLRLRDNEESIRGQRDRLEDEVKKRTAELVVARDQALSSSRHKSEFLAMITHELRTPLQAIVGYTETVMVDLDGPHNEQHVSDLSSVIHSADHLLALINQILDFSKIESGHQLLYPQEIELAHCVSKIENTITPLARARRNTLSVILKTERETIYVDRDKLNQVVINLLGNACKFTQDGDITFIISCSVDTLSLEVVDTGIGIPESEQMHIFEAFRQVDMRETREHGGTGLGLAITENLVRLMGGSITVRSAPGVGSAFTVLIPLKAPC